MPDINDFDMLYSDNDLDDDRPVPGQPNPPPATGGQHGGYQQFPHGGYQQYPYGGYQQYPYGGYQQYPYGGFQQYPFGGGVPTMPPPSYIPQRPFGYQNPFILRNYINRLVYIWLNDGRNFWALITYVGPRTVQGYRWNGYTWRFFRADFSEIQAFAVI